LNLSGSTFSEAVENQFKNVESAIKELINQVNSNNDDLTTSVRMLEFEKNKLKLEMGKREDVSLHKDVESSSVRGTISALSQLITDSSVAGHGSLSDPAFFIKLEVDKHMEAFKRAYLSQQAEINDLKLLVRKLEGRMSDGDSRWQNECPPQVVE